MFNADQLQGKTGLGKIRGKKLAFETDFEGGFETRYELVLGWFLNCFRKWVGWFETNVS